MGHHNNSMAIGVVLWLFIRDSEGCQGGCSTNRLSCNPLQKKFEVGLKNEKKTFFYLEINNKSMIGMLIMESFLMD